MRKNLFITFLVFGFYSNAFAIRGEGRDFNPISYPLVKREAPIKYVPTIVRLEGEIQDGKNSNHEQGNCYHQLKFVSDEGKVYSIVDSPELVKLHHEKEKNYKISILAEVTPKFLFWGGNLIVESFSVVNEVSNAPHIVFANNDE